MKIIFLFALISIPAPLIALLLLGSVGFVVTLALFILLSYVLYNYSGKILLKWYKAKKVGSLEKLAEKAGVAAPDMYMFDHHLPMIFTAGTKGKFDIAVSSGAMGLFDASELEVMLAREIGHILNNDVPMNTIVALFAGSLASVSTFALWGALLGGFGQDYDPAPRFIRFLGMGLVAVPSALIAQLALSPSREMMADAVSVELTKEPKLLADTLEYMQKYVGHYPMSLNPGHAHLFPLNLLSMEEFYDMHLSLFNTHPDVGIRVKQIMGKVN
ncbi:M48 family metalloprotease [Methanococcoides sp. SA1]|nr:M48 family metalloprotease [Methanococcoides sp. SA1]